MKIARLDLFAYGPFTNAHLDFSRKPSAFQLVYGPNEAGKSTTLRALTALLYGIPVRTEDAHLHEMSRMRVGATLLDERGLPVTVVRRKGKLHTLLDAHDKPLPEAALHTLMQGLDETMFRQMFGLDHARLREGAEALLSGGGHVGEGLFDAGTGARAIRTVMAELKAEADAIFKARGTTTRLQAAVRTLREHQKQRKEAMLSPQTFAEQRRALAEAHRARESALSRRQERLRENSRLTRALSVLPLFSRRDLLARERAELGEVVSLPWMANASEDSLEPQLAAVERERARLQGELSARERALLELPALASSAVSHELVRELERRFGSYLSAQADLPARRAELSMLERDLVTLRTALGQATCVLERLDTPARARLRKLEAEERALARELRELEEAYDLKALELQRHTARLEALSPSGDVSALEALLTQVEHEARGLGLPRLEAELEKRTRELERGLAQLESPLSPEALRRLALPHDGDVAALEAEERALEHAQRTLLDKRAELDAHSKRTERERALLFADGPVVTEEALHEARARRARAFLPLSTALREGTPPLDAERIVEFEAREREADALADQLRKEASRASTLARLSFETQALEREQVALAEAKASLDTRARALGERTRTLLGPLGLALESKATAREKRQKLALLVQKSEERDALRAELEVLTARAHELRTSLARALGSPEEHALVELVARAHERVAQHKAGALRRAELSARVDDLTSTLQGLERRLSLGRARRSDFQARFEAELRALGFGSALTPDEVLAAVDELSQLREKTREAEALRERIASMERETASLANDVRAACEGQGAEMNGSVEQALELLVLSHRAREQTEQERTRLVAELEALRATYARVQHEHAKLLAERDRLFTSAKVDTFAALREVQRREERARSLDASLEQLDLQLASAGEGLTLEELRAEVRGLDADEARARVLTLAGEIEALGEEIDARNQEIGRIELGIEQLEQASGAVLLAEETEADLALVRSLARRYAELRVALAILTREVERYRVAHQGPVLARAGELFPRLTLERYRGLEVELDDKDQPVLCCVRRDQKTVRVEGLSDGTRDQLYLALRVASIERYLEKNTPMPLVLDDAFVHFDDARSSAALSVLGALCARTQVIFFTHHARMVELAKKVLGRDKLLVHELDPARGSIHARDDGPLFARV